MRNVPLHMESAVTVYCYLRVSTKDQATDDKNSLETQRKRCAAAATLLGEDAPTLVTEPGYSGGKPLAERPHGGPMVAGLQHGDMVIVSKLDRAFRNAEDALSTARRFQASGIDLVICDMGSEPVTQNGASRLFFGMLALVAEFERERITERLMEGRAGKAARGGYAGGKVPFGWRAVGKGVEAMLEEVPEHQWALGRIPELRAQGLSYRAIASELGAQGVRVSHMTVGQVLKGV